MKGLNCCGTTVAGRTGAIAAGRPGATTVARATAVTVAAASTEMAASANLRPGRRVGSSWVQAGWDRFAVASPAGRSAVTAASSA
jgi:hypothetical protein